MELRLKAFRYLRVLGMALVLLPKALQAQDDSNWHFSGFGTLAAVHSDNPLADYTSTRFQNNGPGRNSAVSWATDSRVGAQLNLRLPEQFELVAQVVAQQQFDSRFLPTLEWFNLGYKVSNDLHVRIGRTALPIYLISDTRYLGYGMPWVRVPPEVYGTVPLTSNDGVDLAWRQRHSGFTNSLQMFAGRTSVKVPGPTSTTPTIARSQPTWGFANTLEWHKLTLRGSYTRFGLDVDSVQANTFNEQMDKLINWAASVPLPSFQTAAADAKALKTQFGVKDRSMRMVAVGATYDPGSYFLSGEYLDFAGASYLASSQAWHVGAGFRRGAWTPFISHAKSKPRQVVAEHLYPTGAPEFDGAALQIVDGLNDTLRKLNGEQSTLAVGVRWDVQRNLALKGQWERVQTGPRSIGRFVNELPGFEGSRTNVFSLAVDYVF